MQVLVDPVAEEHLEAIHCAIDYIPKRAIRYFLQADEGRMAFLIQEIDDFLHHPDAYSEEESPLLFYGMMILAALHREEGMAFVSRIGSLSIDPIDLFLGNHLFDSFALAVAELYKYHVPELKAFIENEALEPAIRASAIQSLIYLFGQGIISRNEATFFLKALLEKRREKIPYFYDLIASASFALHPEEMMEELRAAFQEGFIDTDQIQLQNIEDVLALSKEQVVEESREMLRADLKDLIGHLELAQQRGSEVYERNDPCPCGSGQKYKKCCH